MIRTTVLARLALVLIAAGFGINNLQAAAEGAAANPATATTQTGELYLPSDDAMANVSVAMDSARKNNKLVLVVMGANWCHDSRALAARLYEAPLSDVIEANYETVFVDVGFLENGKDVITSLGSPVYYATPTVLIADPESGEVINDSNRHQWADAAGIGMQESVDYFQRMADKSMAVATPEAEVPIQLQELLDEIDAFEQVQAVRLYQAYAVLGPMLRAFKSGDKEAFSEPYWSAVRDFRYKLPKDLDDLREEAVKRTAAGETDVRLAYPQYPAFPWEK